VPLPNNFSIGGGGNYCAGGAGVNITLNGSQVGTNYLLYMGSTPTGIFTGTGLPLDFGLQTVGGTYYVVAINTTTGCTRTMAGTVSITVDPNTVPAVNISAAIGSPLCAGTKDTFAAIPTGGGLTPAYAWSVNGIPVGAGNKYAFVPADGDVVSVAMTSSAHCPLPAIAVGNDTVHVVLHQTPAVALSASPSDAVCRGQSVTLTAVPSYGGTAPVISWTRNHAPAGTGMAYSFIPSNGDVVNAFMTSNYFCRTADTASSYNVRMVVDTPIIPHVTVNTNPGYVTGAASRTITFSAAVTDGGDAPTYQWRINGVPQVGANAPTFTHTGFHTEYQDSVSVDVTSSGVCPMTSHGWVYIEVNNVGVNAVSMGGNVTIIPNPNKGEFVIKGALGTVNDQDVSLEVTDVLGQQVYTAKIVAKSGQLNERVRLDGHLANGMYIVNLHTEGGNKIFHMVVEK
jgi:hypothetical protein